MRILYQHRTQAADGGYVHIKALTDALAALGHEVLVLGPQPKTETGFGKEGTLIDRLRAALPKALYELLEYAYSWIAFRRLWRTYKRFQPDVYYERYNLFFLPGVWLRRKTGVPMISEVNAPLYQERRDHGGGLALQTLAQSSERAVWTTADAVLPVTDVLADHCRAAGVPEDHIAVIPNGAGPEFLAPDIDGAETRLRYGLGNRLVLGFTGFVRPWHGLDRILDLMAESPAARDAHLLLVGDGPARGDLEHKAAALGLADRFTVTGVQPHEAMPGLVASFDIALQPSVVAYASPLKLVEYMALGRAIVAPDTANIREVMVSGETGLLFDPEDTDGLRQAVERLCADAGLRQRLGLAARATVRTRDLTWAGNARRVVAIAEKLIQARAGPA